MRATVHPQAKVVICSPIAQDLIINNALDYGIQKPFTPGRALAALESLEA
jgi:hypothetical protein